VVFQHQLRLESMKVSNCLTGPLEELVHGSVDDVIVSSCQAGRFLNVVEYYKNSLRRRVRVKNFGKLGFVCSW
jgi:hypothetical protein